MILLMWFGIKWGWLWGLWRYIVVKIVTQLTSFYFIWQLEELYLHTVIMFSRKYINSRWPSGAKWQDTSQNCVTIQHNSKSIIDWESSFLSMCLWPYVCTHPDMFCGRKSNLTYKLFMLLVITCKPQNMSKAGNYFTTQFFLKRRKINRKENFFINRNKSRKSFVCATHIGSVFYERGIYSYLFYISNIKQNHFMASSMAYFARFLLCHIPWRGKKHKVISVDYERVLL